MEQAKSNPRPKTRDFIRIRLRLFEFAISHSLEELIQKTMDEAGILTESPVGFFHFVESDQKTLSLQAWSTRTINEFCKAEGKGSHYEIDRAGVWVDCVHQRRPVIHNDYASLPHRKGLPPGHAAIIRELVVPVMRDDRIMAILGVGNKLADYTEEDVEKVSFLADVAWEIVEHKRADEALMEKEAFLDALINAIPIPVFYKDRAGRYLGFNKAFETFFGETREHMIGKSVFEINPPELAKIYHARDETLFEDKEVQQYESQVMNAHGVLCDVIFQKSVFADNKGAISGLIGTVLDITERKRAEQEREKLILELQENLQKVKLLSGLLPICAHCKKIRDDKGYWNQIESYIKDHSGAEFSHGICPECEKKYYSEIDVCKKDV